MKGSPGFLALPEWLRGGKKEGSEEEDQLLQDGISQLQKITEERAITLPVSIFDTLLPQIRKEIHDTAEWDKIFNPLITLVEAARVNNVEISRIIHHGFVFVEYKEMVEGKDMTAGAVRRVGRHFENADDWVELFQFARQLILAGRDPYLFIQSAYWEIFKGAPKEIRKDVFNQIIQWAKMSFADEDFTAFVRLNPGTWGTENTREDIWLELMNHEGC